MIPAWLVPWLGAPLSSLDEAQLTTALEAARQIVDRLSQEAPKDHTDKGQVEVEAMLAEWQAVVTVILHARADRFPTTP